MNTSHWITIWGIATGLFVTTIGSALVLSFKIGMVHEKVISIERKVDRVVDEDIPRIDKTIGKMQIEMAEIQIKVDVLWKHHLATSNSPLTLNSIGLDVLKRSNIEKFTSDHYFEILSKIRIASPQNAYQAQEVLISIVNDYQHKEECRSVLQDAAFKSGYDVMSVLFVAALSIRDRVIADLGF